MIKLVIFDLDGVLVEAKNIHFEAFNKALGEYAISWDEHLSIYDGLKTNQKLDMLHERKGLPKEQFINIWNNKQKYTLEALSNLKKDEILYSTIQNLSLDGYKLAVCSNSIRKTVLTVLSKLGIIEFFDLILSNEDVKNSKPHPEIYWKAISEMSCLPEETLIVEDSPYGLLSASRSKSHILRVGSPKEVTYINIKNKINTIKENYNMKSPAWRDEKLNVLIPMAGAGSRFEQAGYTFPKPLIEVRNKPMIQVVVDNLNIKANYIYIVQKKHREKYNLDTLLNLLTPNCRIVEVDGLTEGAACTALLAKEFIDKMNETNADGGIVTFEATHPKWSFAKIDNKGLVTEVAEKNPISNIATVGYYYWKHGSDFVKYAEQMIDKNIRINNEFYVCPVFNQAIEDSKEIRTFNVDGMWGLGTPEDLKYYLENHK